MNEKQSNISMRSSLQSLIITIVTLITLILIFLIIELHMRFKTISITPNSDILWNSYLENEKTKNKTHTWFGGEVSAKRLFQIGVQRVTIAMQKREPIYLAYGGGDIAGRDEPPRKNNSELGIPYRWQASDELTEPIDWDGEYAALRWYSEQGIYPVNSRKIFLFTIRP